MHHHLATPTDSMHCPTCGSAFEVECYGMTLLTVCHGYRAPDSAYDIVPGSEWDEVAMRGRTNHDDQARADRHFRRRYPEPGQVRLVDEEVF